MAAKSGVPERLPDSTIYLARAVTAAAQRSGKPLRDPRIAEAARRRMGTGLVGNHILAGQRPRGIGEETRSRRFGNASRS